MWIFGMPRIAENISEATISFVARIFEHRLVGFCHREHDCPRLRPRRWVINFDFVADGISVDSSKTFFEDQA